MRRRIFIENLYRPRASFSDVLEKYMIGTRPHLSRFMRDDAMYIHIRYLGDLLLNCSFRIFEWAKHLREILSAGIKYSSNGHLSGCFLRREKKQKKLLFI